VSEVIEVRVLHPTGHRMTECKLEEVGLECLLLFFKGARVSSCSLHVHALVCNLRELNSPLNLGYLSLSFFETETSFSLDHQWEKSSVQVIYSCFHLQPNRKLTELNLLSLLEINYHAEFLFELGVVLEPDTHYV
jgi:hypothetical protein